MSKREQRIYDFLSQTQTGVLSTVDPNNNPHGVVIYFAIDQNFCVSFLTRNQTRKYDNLKHTNHAMITVFDPASQTTAQITGEANELTDSEAINNVAKLMLEASLKHSDTAMPPITKLDAGSYVAFEIRPVQIHLAQYGQPKSGDYTTMFDSLESFELHTT